MRFLPSVRLKINFRRMLRITLIWTIVGAVDAIFTHLLSESIFFETTGAYRFGHYFLINSSAFAVAGLITGFILIFYLKNPYRRLAFWQNLLVKSIIIIAFSILLSLLANAGFYTWKLDIPFFSGMAWQRAMDIFLSPFHIKITGIAFLLTMGTILFLNISNKYGPGMFIQYLLGRYHQPTQEERIFLFVDMNSSTTIAESLGHIAFHNLLNDFFRDLTNAILYTRGQVYQYVGDQVVITWPMNLGLRNLNCVRCFYSMKEAIHRRADHYRSKYGLVPEFKAGLHSGQVTTGEIGVLKRELVYSGDVLNTTARMQDLCREYGVKILLSKRLLDKLNLPPDRFELKKIGDIDLRGKKEKVRLYTLEDT